MGSAGNARHTHTDSGREQRSQVSRMAPDADGRQPDVALQAERWREDNAAEPPTAGNASMQKGSIPAIHMKSYLK